MGLALRSETSFEKHDVLRVILNFDPLVSYGTTVQTHGFASVFPLNKASKNQILISLI